jgi:hypothetical protein
LRLLGLRPAGGNFKTLRDRLARWSISTDHFDPYAAARTRPRRRIPLEDALVRGSTYRRHALKERLYTEGLKRRECEQCGQGEEWHGRRMSLILDHVNGVADDNRLGNLQIVCPNCAATLETHCGRNKPRLTERSCALCSGVFMPKYGSQRFCSRYCALHRKREAGEARPGLRKVQRPPYARLLETIAELGYEATGRQYGVSGNAIRKWVRAYEAQNEAAPQ